MQEKVEEHGCKERIRNSNGERCRRRRCLIRNKGVVERHRHTINNDLVLVKTNQV